MIPVTSAPRRSRAWLLGALAAAGVLVWWVSRGDDVAPAAQPDTAGAPAIKPFAPIRRLADGSWGAQTFAPRRFGFDAADGLARVRGKVVDAHDGAPVGGVAVVFSGESGETEATAADDGTYELALAPGAYHAFVRGDGVMSIGTPEPERLPGGPSADDVDAPATQLAPAIAIAHDTSGVDLPVERGGVVTGHVLDDHGHAIAHALVRARGDVRPVLGGDVAETDATGAFQLTLPAGVYQVDATHPDYASLADGVAELDLLPGTRATSLDLTMTAGCIVRGRVVGPNGQPAGDGAMEAKLGADEFQPLGRIEPDGTFRFTTLADASFELRAWPWKSPPSQPQTFRCTPGARFDAQFTIPIGSADLDGTILTADGRPAAGAYLDVLAVSEGGTSQQERASDDGSWAVYDMPAGDYVVTASVPGEGSVSRTVHVPAHGVALALAGTGAIDGTIKGVDDGTLAMMIGHCDDQPAGVYAAPETRLVPVRGGHFHLDRVPACSLYVSTARDGRAVGDEVQVAAGHETPLALDLTPPRTIEIDGKVLAADGTPAAGALVRAWNDSGMTETTVAADGSYRIKAEVGSELIAMRGDDGANADVPTTAPDVLHVDLKLQAGDLDEIERVSAGDDEAPEGAPDPDPPGQRDDPL